MIARTVSSIAAIALCAVASPAFADEDPATGFYLGAGAAYSLFDADNFDVDDIDDSDLGWKVMGGARFHPNFAVEGSYTDFGGVQGPSVPLVGRFEAEAEAFSLYGVGFIPLPWFDVFGKLGAARIDADGGGAGVLAFEDDETELAFGAGVQWRWSNLAIRAEYEMIDTDMVDDLDVFSLGVTYTFGRR